MYIMCKLHDMYSSLIIINTNHPNSLLGSQPIRNENNLEHYYYGCIKTIMFNLSKFTIITI